ncbi:UNVERIFIED_CONTAM: Cationic amino acid transporter 9, chloroplastic [Sesamum angustifolium]|uniref:Cationic amino acid transporter 9, chloroplastic n=1 Tax=Sesamum angustifolium TaxID=2727405 RepID=A0AAW2RHV8_9LAMI
MRTEQSSVVTSSSSSMSTPSCRSRFWSSALRSKPLAPAPDTAVRAESGDGLVRRLGLFDLILLGIGASIGAGIFVVTGTVAHDAGPGVTISFIIAGVSCVLNALCYAELASRFPAVVGGAYLYTYAAFNEITAFLVFTQLMLDYHIGAASIARSLASYVVTVLELIPFLTDNIPNWVGHGEEVLGALSINILAPIILVLLTAVLCRGVGESSILNSIMTVTKVMKDFEIKRATVVFFAYVGFDAVANSAEESKRPQRDLPLGIIGSLMVCVALYIGVSLVITGMVPYQHLGEEAPLSEAFTSKGLKYVSVLISLVLLLDLQQHFWLGFMFSLGCILDLEGMVYYQLCLAKYTQHGIPQFIHKFGLVLLPAPWPAFLTSMCSHIFYQLDPWVNGLFQTGYSVVSACVVRLRWKDEASSQASTKLISSRAEGITYLLAIACCGFTAGVLFRFGASFIFLIVAAVIGILSAAALYVRHVHTSPPGFSCPGVPIVPSISIFLNMFLFAQLHYEAWVRFVVLSIVALVIYASYGPVSCRPSVRSFWIY